MHNRKGQRAFTLIELLVVVAIIAVLAAILFPVLAQAREAARRTACLSNAKQIGSAVMLYLSDYDGTFPIFYAYMSNPHARQPGHKGVETQLAPYAGGTVTVVGGVPMTHLQPIFRCPLDQGGPYTDIDVPGATSYWEAYGSSYRFTKCAFSVIENESSQNNILYNYTKIVREGDFVAPADTRIIRDEMFAIFDRKNTPDACPRYGYDCDPPWNFYRRWHINGGTMIFADGHARHIVGTAKFDDALISPEGNRTGDAHPTEGTWYWACD